jgi:hypothetical protein
LTDPSMIFSSCQKNVFRSDRGFLIPKAYRRPRRRKEFRRIPSRLIGGLERIKGLSPRNWV